MNELFDNSENNANDRINELTELINKYDYAYYVESNSLVSDFDYDKLFKELADLEKSNPQLKRPDSPTNRLFSDSIESFKQIEHKVPMLSLANTYNMNEVQDFFNRANNLLEGQPFELTAELKYDGVAISVVYQDGYLSYAVTRGDGTKGDDITANAKTIKSIPLKANHFEIDGIVLKNFEVRGEVYLQISDFLEINRIREEQGEKLYANPRNLASGTLKNLNPSLVAKRPLKVAFYHLITDDLRLSNQFDNYNIIKELGLPISPFYEHCNSIDEVEKYINKWQTKRFELDFQIDGIVLKINSLKQQDMLGFVGRTPRWAIAYKYSAETAQTLLKDITLQVGRTGAITPVAELEPIELAGSTISRATLHNYDYIKERDIRIGDIVQIEKGGEVIPKVIAPIIELRKEGTEPYIFPEFCPCEHKSPLVRIEGEANYYCTNPICNWQLKRRIEHFASRDAMNIEGLGEKIVDTLVDEKLINSVADLFLLKEHTERLEQLEKWGKKKTENLINAIEKSKQQPFHRLLFALGIRFVGAKVSKILASTFNSIEKLQNASIEEIASIHEIGDKIATSVYQFFKNSYNIMLIEQLQKEGLQFQQNESEATSSNALLGKTFVFTGELETMSRSEAAKLVESLGGKESKSVSKNTSYVVVGANAGSKADKARQLNLNILTEEEFLEMVR